MRFSRPGLPVREETDVVTIEGALDELGDFLEYQILSRRGGEYLVEFESVILANMLAQYGEALAVG